MNDDFDMYDTPPERDPGRRRKREGGFTTAGMVGLVAVVLLVLVGIIGYTVYYFGSTADSATNERCIVYKGGTFEDKAFQGFTEPGSTKAKIGWGSKQYCYRNDQRSYIGSTREGADTAPVQVVGGSSGESNSTVRLSVDYQMYFKLNVSDAKLQKFHENIGVKTKAYQEDGWREMLRDYLEPQIERSMEAEALNFPWDKLYGDEEVRQQYQAAVVKRLKTAVREVVGDDYFCGPSYTGRGECGNFTFTIGKPDLLNGDLIKAIESEETAKRQTQAQTEKNATAARKREQDEALVKLYGPQGALIAKAIESGKVTAFYITPEGTIVPAPTPG